MRKRNSVFYKIINGVTRARYAFAAVLLFVASGSHAQVTATFKADSNKIEIGDPLHFKIAVQAPKNFLVQLPKFDGDTIGKLEVIGRSKVDTGVLADKNIYTQTITVSAYDSGSYYIAPQLVYFLNDQKQTDSVLTNDFIVETKTLDVDTSKPIKAIKSPLKVEYQLKEFTWWIVAAVVLLLLIISYLLYRKYKKKPVVTDAKPRPKEPAHIWAANELKKLDDEKLWQNDQHKLYHSRISDILRSYLEYRYDVSAMESTTDEIALLINNLSINNANQNRLIETLKLSDFAKFAKMTPLPDQNMRSMENAKAFVENTKSVEVAEDKPKTN